MVCGSRERRLRLHCREWWLLEVRRLWVRRLGAVHHVLLLWMVAVSKLQGPDCWGRWHVLCELELWLYGGWNRYRRGCSRWTFHERFDFVVSLQIRRVDGDVLLSSGNVDSDRLVGIFGDAWSWNSRWYKAFWGGHVCGFRWQPCGNRFLDSRALVEVGRSARERAAISEGTGTLHRCMRRREWVVHTRPFRILCPVRLPGLATWWLVAVVASWRVVCA